MAGGNSYLDKLRLGQNVILTNLAMGYSNASLIADKLYPVIPTTGFPTLRVPEMNRDNLKIIDDLRTLYGDTVQPKNGSLTYHDVSMREHSQKRAIDIQEILADAVIDLRKTRTYAVTESMLLNIEKDVADEVQTTSNYTNSNTETLTGTDQWTHASSNPITQIWDAMETVRGLIGKYPNTMTLGATSKWSLAKNSAVVTAIKGANAGGVVTMKEISDYFDMEVVVGSSVYDNSEDVTDTFAPVDLWLDNCILAYVTKTPTEQRSMYEPSFGYTFKHKDFNPLISTHKRTDGKVEFIEGTMIWAKKMYNDACAYLIKDTNV